MTREAFENAIVANAAIGGPPTRRSTSTPSPSISACRSTATTGSASASIPLLVDMQPAGSTSARNTSRAGGLPAVLAELIGAGKIREEALTCNGRTIGENCRGKHTWDREVIRSYDDPLQGEGRLPQPEGDAVRFGDHEDERDLQGVPRALPRQSRGSVPSRAGSWSSTGRRITTTASTIHRSTSTSTRS